MTIKGSLEAPKEAPPLILIVEPAPGSPPVFIAKPATLPFSKFSAVVIFPLLKSLEVIAVTEPVASFTVVDP